MPITRSIVLLFLLNATQTAFAWNDFGHMAIAAIAYPQLTPVAKRRVTELLQRNPDYAEWTHAVAPAERERIAFMRAATWADAIKGDSGYSDNRERGSGAIRPGTGCRERLQHRAWHYINTPFSPDRTPLRAPKPPNLHTQLFELQLALRAPDMDADTQSFSLVWLLHLIGDAHQPLHAATRFTRDLPDGDRGGNAIVVCAKTCDRDLHGVWDGMLGNSRKPDVVLRAIAAYPQPDAHQAATIDEADWLAESAAIAQRVAYAEPVPLRAEPVTLSRQYKSTARAVAEEQAALAGARLARVLNRLFGESGQ